MQILNRFAKLEQFLFSQMDDQEHNFALKELNEAALNKGIPHTYVRDIRSILYYLQVLGLLPRHDICAKLIQSMDGFRLYDLAETRFFLKAVDRRQGSAPIKRSLAP